jgi:hypothetical protein
MSVHDEDVAVRTARDRAAEALSEQPLEYVRLACAAFHATIVPTVELRPHASRSRYTSASTSICQRGRALALNWRW